MRVVSRALWIALASGKLRARSRSESWREISGWEWIEHIRKLTIRKITDDSPDVQVPGLTARNVSSPFDHYSPFCPWKRLIASVMVETLQAAVQCVRRRILDSRADAFCCFHNLAHTHH